MKEKLLKEQILFTTYQVSAGHSPFDIEGAIEPNGYVIDIPGMNNTETLLPVRGFSMQPEIKDVSIVGVKAVSGWDYLNTHNKYLIITHEDRMIKYI